MSHGLKHDGQLHWTGAARVLMGQLMRATSSRHTEGIFLLHISVHYPVDLAVRQINGGQSEPENFISRVKVV